MLLRQFLCVGLAILLTSLGTVSSSHLSIISDELYILSRVVTEIELSNEELVSSIEVERKLCGLPPGEALYKIISEKVTTLPQLLQSIVKEAEKVCSGQPNSDIRLDTHADTVIEEGIKFFESIDKSKVADISESFVRLSETAPTLLLFSSKYRAVFRVIMKSDWGKVFDKYMQKDFTATDDTTELFDLVINLKHKEDLYNHLVSAVNNMNQISYDDFKGNISTLEKLENLRPVNHAKTVNDLIKELDKVLPAFKQLGEALSFDNVKNVFSFIDRMNRAFIPSKMRQKNILIDTVMNEFENTFLKRKMIPWNVNNMSYIANATYRVAKLRISIADIINRLENFTIGREILHIEKTIQEEIKKAHQGLKPLILLKTVRSCASRINFSKRFKKMYSTSDVEEYFTNLWKLSAAINNTVGSPFKYTPLLLEFVEIKSKENRSGLLMDFKKHATQFKRDLMDLKLQHKPYEFPKLLPFMDLEDYISESTKYLNYQAIRSDCVDQYTDLLKESRNSKTASVTCPHFLSTTDENWKKMIATAEGLSYLNPPRLPTPINPIRKRRSNHMTLIGVSEDLEGGVEVVLRLAEVFEKRDSIRKLMAAEAQIDAEVAKLTDAEQKTAIETVWNTATKNSLKALPDDIEKLDGKLAALPRNISEYGMVFQAAHSFDFPAVDTQKLIHVLRVTSLPADVQRTLDEVGELDLDFVSARQKLASAEATLPSIEKFFSDLFFIPPPVQQQNQGEAPQNSPQEASETKPTGISARNGNNDETDGKTSESSSISVVSLILICGFILLIAVSLGGLAYWKRADLKDMFKGQKNEKTEAKSGKNTTSRSLENQEKASGSKEV